MFRLWAAGRGLDYRPSLADLWALDAGWAEEPQTVIHTYPVAMQVVRIV